MVPKTIEELNQIREECRTMVKKRASASAIAAAIPVPGVDISADVGIMLELLPAINRKFGLTPEQIEQLDEETKRIILVLVTSIGSELVGRTITKQLVAKLLKKVGARVAAKNEGSKWIASFVLWNKYVITISLSPLRIPYLPVFPFHIG